MKKGKLYLAAFWLLAVFVVACLTACSTPDTTYVPTDVDMAVATPCKAPDVSKPTDLLLALPQTASLTDGLKACLAQHDYDIGYQSQLEASVAACK